MFEQLEARRLMSVVSQAGIFNTLTATQSGSGTLNIKATAAMQVTVIEAGTFGDPHTPDFPDGILYDLYGPGTVRVHEDTSGSETIFNGVNTAKPINIQGGAGGGANSVFFDGLTHPASMNLGGGPNSVVATDEGDGGSKILCGGGNNQVNVLFSHNVLISLGGGTNNVFVNSFIGGGVQVSGTTTNGTVLDSDIPSTIVDPTIKLGDTSHDLVTVVVGGGVNNIFMFAGNVQIKAGGGFDTLYTGAEGSLSIVDIIKEAGIETNVSFNVF